MTTITVYANCQSGPLLNLLQRGCSRLEGIRIRAAHTLRPEDADGIFATVRAADIVVHQPIGSAFGPISSESLKAEFPGKTFVSFPSIYYAGWFPQLVNIRLGGPMLTGPIGDYHDHRILKAFLAGLPVSEAIRIVEEDGTDYAPIVDELLANSLARDAAVDVPAMDMMLALAEAECPMHTFNHPTTALLWGMALRILKHLGLPADAGAAAPGRPLLGKIEAMVPRHLAAAGWEREAYRVRSEPVATPALCEAFYALYAGTPDLAGVYRRNIPRLGPVART